MHCYVQLNNIRVNETKEKSQSISELKKTETALSKMTCSFSSHQPIEYKVLNSSKTEAKTAERKQCNVIFREIRYSLCASYSEGSGVFCPRKVLLLCLLALRRDAVKKMKGLPMGKFGMVICVIYCHHRVNAFH